MFQPKSQRTVTFTIDDKARRALGFAIGAYMQSCNPSQVSELNAILLKIDDCGSSMGVTVREAALLKEAVEHTKFKKYKRQEPADVFEDLSQLLDTPQVDLDTIMFSRRRIDLDF